MHHLITVCQTKSFGFPKLHLCFLVHVMNPFHASLKEGRARTTLDFEHVLFLVKAERIGGVHISPL
jgi:hypothetical protein